MIKRNEEKLRTQTLWWF